MNELDKKINECFAGLVVRKDLVKEVKGNAIVPTFVLEYLLGQYCASDDDDTIRSGIDMVKSILAEHYVHRNEANLTRSLILQNFLIVLLKKLKLIQRFANIWIFLFSIFLTMF